MEPLKIRIADFDDPQTRDLLALHLAGMRASSPPESVYALDLSGLKKPEITTWSAWRGNRLAGVGALRMLSADAAEIKSMRTHPDFLKQGVGKAILAHIVETAKQRGIKRLSLETGSGPAFDAAVQLYRNFGFQFGEPFGDYVPTGFSQFLHLEIV
jgi:putative acetyltransferase